MKLLSMVSSRVLNPPKDEGSTISQDNLFHYLTTFRVFFFLVSNQYFPCSSMFCLAFCNFTTHFQEESGSIFSVVSLQNLEATSGLSSPLFSQASSLISQSPCGSCSPAPLVAPAGAGQRTSLASKSGLFYIFGH